MKKTLLFILGLPLILCVSPLIAGTTGKLAGSITEAETKEPIPGVNVILEGTTLGAMADNDGYYHVINIPPGRYDVVFSCMGYTTKRMENVRVNIDLTSSLSVELNSTVIEGEEVTVVAEKPMVQADLTSTSARVSREQIQDLHLETVGQVVNLQAGVVEGHFRGGRHGEVAYMIDGIAVTDVYSGGNLVNLEANSIEEVEVISGTFNAEYGRVMSGVVNIVSRQPSRKFSGSLSAYTGAYLSGRKLPFVAKSSTGLVREDYYEEELSFFELADFNDIYDMQGSLTGPIWQDKLSFFASFRNHKSDGYMYGRRFFSSSDSSIFTADRENWMIEATGDGEIVPMNWSESISAHGKLIAKLSNRNKLTYEYIYEDDEGQGYSHGYKYNPDGRPTSYGTSNSHMLHYDFVINANGFINLKAASLEREYKSYVYESPYDSRYVSDDRLDLGSGPRFNMGGANMDHNWRKTTTNIFKSDLTYQVDKYNQIKSGVDAKLHEMNIENYAIRLDRFTNWQARPVSELSPNYTKFTKKPMELSAYIQDKIEWSYFIMNVGLRYDWFEPDGVYPADLENPSTSERIKANSKSKWSPRFGIAMPVTEKSVMHLSYGLFFQVPNFDVLYTNPDFRIPLNTNVTIGNTDLRPQETSSYELGLQHEINPNMAVDMTVYYRDIRNLLGMEVYTLRPSLDQYARYVNRDYGQTFGFIIAFEQRGQYLNTTVDYTYMIAEGNASDPNDVYLKSQTSPPTEITKQLIYLDWDRTHSLNITTTVKYQDKWNLGFIGKIGSGFPYTPEVEGYYPSKENTERKPYYINFDLNFDIAYNIGGLRTILFTKIYNIFDIRNEIGIYTDTGRATYSLSQRYERDELIVGVNTVKDYYYRQNYYSAPRLVQAGLKVEF